MLQFHAGIVVGGSCILALMMISFAYMISYFCDLQHAMYTFANAEAAVFFVQTSDKMKSCSESVEVAIGTHLVVGNCFFPTDPVASAFASISGASGLLFCITFYTWGLKSSPFRTGSNDSNAAQASPSAQAAQPARASQPLPPLPPRREQDARPR